MAEHDSGYKLLFSHPRTVEELLRGFLHEEWVSGLDFATLERVGGSFVSDDLRERHSDAIWRLRWEGAGEGWFYVYLLLEFQSTPSPFMAVRLLGYAALLLAEIVRKERLGAGDRLPIVLPLVLYNGKRPWTAPLDLASLFAEAPESLRRRLPQLSYLLVDESRLRPEELALPESLVATLFQLETCGPQDLPRLTSQLATLLAEGAEPELRRAFTAWVLRLLRRSLPGVTIPEVVELEEMPMLEETLKEWWGSGFAEARENGRTEGLREGRMEGMRQLLCKLLEQRFGPLPRKARQQVSAIDSMAELERLARRVLQAESLSAMGVG